MLRANVGTNLSFYFSPEFSTISEMSLFVLFRGNINLVNKKIHELRKGLTYLFHFQHLGKVQRTKYVCPMATDESTLQVHSLHVCSAVSNSLQPHGLQSTKLFCLLDSLDKNIGMGCHVLCPGDLPHPGIKSASLTSPALKSRFFTTSITCCCCCC